MNTDIFLIGSGQTPFGEHWDKSVRDLLEEAMGLAIDDAHLMPTDIDMIIVGNMLAERASGQAQLGALAAALLPHTPPALRVEAACASGSMAIATACSLLESGRAKNILVVGVEKMTDVSTAEIAAGLMGAADGELDTPSGLTFPGIFGLIAQRYMHEYGLTREQLSLVSVRHHANAVSNPFAQFRSAIEARSVEESPPVADPLRMLDCSPISDGAAACILSSTHASPIRIAASQIATDAVSLTDRPTITSFSATRKAMDSALQEAKIEREDISHVETHDCFSIAAVINMEDLGFAEPGRGIELFTRKNSRPVVNGSGGLKACGHPVAATGVKQIIDIAKQLKSHRSSYGLAHNFGGACATCGIHILENTDA